MSEALRRFLEHHGVSIEEIRQEICRELRIERDEPLFACGSLIEDLGNSRSDLDIYWVPAHGHGAFDKRSIAVGTCVVDVQIMSQAHYIDLVSRFERWADQPRRPGTARYFTPEERRQLQHLVQCLPVQHPERVSALTERIDQAALSRLNFDFAIAEIATLQVDLDGFLRVGDWTSAALASQIVLANAIDALLAAHGTTNPNWKWRHRLIQRHVPVDWDRDIPGLEVGVPLAEHWLTLHRLPRALNSSAVTSHVHRIVAFARRVAFWCEWKILTATPFGRPRGGLRAGTHDAGTALPALAVDVCFGVDGDVLTAQTLLRGDRLLHIAQPTLDVLAMFDGLTPRQAAIERMRQYGAADPDSTLDGLIGLVDEAGLLAESGTTSR